MSSAIPVIDLKPLSTTSQSDRASIVRQISSACEATGFFQITGHGVDVDLVERMFAVSQDFFDLPAAAKSQIGEAGPQPGGLMYCPLMRETLAGSLGEAAPGDLKESLDFGPGFYGSHWPSHPASLQAVWLEYYGALSEVAAALRELFSIAIGLPANYFEPLFDQNLSSLRVLDYPQAKDAPAPGQLRAGAHSDYGFLTILRASPGSSGLEIRDADDEWRPVNCVPDAFVINLGDAMMRWTNDRWRSSVHRVVIPPDLEASRRRNAIAFFHNPNADAVIDVFDAFITDDSPKRYAPVSYHDYALGKYRQTHGEEAPNPFAAS